MNARVKIDDETVARALAADKTCARVLAKGLRPAAGDLVGVRLNLNLFKSQKIAVQTIHKGLSRGPHAREGQTVENRALADHTVAHPAVAERGANEEYRSDGA